MALRSFEDELGRMWLVWTVQPPFGGDAHTDGLPQGEQPVERQHRQRISIALDAQWAGGWLAFETPGERRRLAPWPTDWTAFSEHELIELCAKAQLVRKARTQSTES